jgi:hypothetical protein
MTTATVRTSAGAFGALRTKLAAVAAAFGAAVVGAAAFLAVSAGPAEAVPSYARQTGQPCATCHTAFPELTPYGRRFKIGGYTTGGGDWKGPPLAAMYMPSFTHTQSPYDGTAAQEAAGILPPNAVAAPAGLHTNDNLVSQQVTGFIAGQLYGNLGSFIQVTGDPVYGGVALDASDVRYADTFELFGKGAIWGIDANNTPTVEDPWNTTPAFGWPQIASTIAPAFAPPLTAIESEYNQTVGGAGAYVFWNDMLYADLTFYKGLTVPELQAFGDGNSTTDALSNVAPYWRLAVEPHWGDLFWEAGTFGMYGQVTPGRVYGYGTDNYLDVGFDSQIQYDGDPYSVTVKLTDIMEWQRLNSSFAQGFSSNLNDTLNSFKANVSFVWDHTYSIGFGYFRVDGSSDCNMYGSPAAPCMPDGLGAFANSYKASPLGDGLILDLAWLPFSHGAPSPPLPYSTMNVRLGLQFTSYLHLYGGTTNFDGSYLGGTHNAQGNNSVFAYAWIAW